MTSETLKRAIFLNSRKEKLNKQIELLNTIVMNGSVGAVLYPFCNNKTTVLNIDNETTATIYKIILSDNMKELNDINKEFEKL